VVARLGEALRTPRVPSPAPGARGLVKFVRGHPRLVLPSSSFLIGPELPPPTPVSCVGRTRRPYLGRSLNYTSPSLGRTLCLSPIDFLPPAFFPFLIRLLIRLDAKSWHPALADSRPLNIKRLPSFPGILKVCSEA
jgi:hypothetical protein